jgi:hypothetical protein
MISQFFNRTVRSHILAFGLGLTPGAFIGLYFNSIIINYIPDIDINFINMWANIFLILTIIGSCMIIYGIWERHNIIYYPIDSEKYAILHDHHP